MINSRNLALLDRYEKEVLVPARKSATSFAYHSIQDKGRRAAPQSKNKDEDNILKPKDRLKLQSTARDQARNMALVAWMIRRHLDYVSRFDVQVRTGHSDLDDKVESLFKWHSRAVNFDVAQRHSRNAAMRLMETHKVIDGDALFIKLKTGNIQAIETDRLTKPSDLPKGKNVSDFGLVLGKKGEVLEYCICSRDPGGSKYAFEEFIAADDVIYDGYFSRFDQTRGISPLAAAINQCADLYESWEWTLLKIKLHSLFGLAFKRGGAESEQAFNAAGQGSSTAGPAPSTSAVIAPQQGLMTLDIGKDDSVDTIESKTPSAEMMNFSEMMIRIALLALDIPFTAFNSMKSSFSARIADRNEYEQACVWKREKNRDVLQSYSDWKISEWAINPKFGISQLLSSYGMTPLDLQLATEWIPAGSPWLDKLNEIQGDIKAVSIGADSIPRICKRRGLDAYSLADENAEFLKYAKEKGVPVSFGEPGQAIIQPDSQNDKTPPDESNSTDEAMQ